MKKNYQSRQGVTLYHSFRTMPSTIPFTFCYNGERHQGAYGCPELSREVEKLANGERVTVKYAFADGIEMTVHLAFWRDYGGVEWRVEFTNTSDENSGIFTELMAMDTSLRGHTPVLRGILGDRQKQFYRPYVHELEKEPIEFVNPYGRPTHWKFPYFNLEHGDGGTLIALGWAGTWKANFEARYNETFIRMTGNPELDTYLKPGETISSALVVMIPYTVRDEEYASNLWRSWFINCNLPKKNVRGDALTPFVATAFCNDTGRPNADGSISEDYESCMKTFRAMLDKGFKPDYRWVDAGWYDDGAGNSVEYWDRGSGSHTLDPNKWPDDTFAKCTDFARENGIKTFLWFEPERVGCDALENLIANRGYKREWAVGIRTNKMTYINNLGNPECYKWTRDAIFATLKKAKVDMYREDHNYDPAPHWEILDEREGEHRRGISENNSVLAHYRLYGELVAYNPENTFIDVCAGGGGRSDVWSMRYGFPILRSDADRKDIPLRLSMTHSLTKWLPFCGAEMGEKESELALETAYSSYAFRASYLPAAQVHPQWTQKPDLDFELIKKHIAELRTVQKYLLCDFYTLTPWHDYLTDTTIDAFEYLDAETECGFMTVLRQTNAEDNSVTLTLRGLDACSHYTLTDADTGEAVTLTGKELCSYTVVLPEKHTAKLIYINKEGN